MRHVLSQEATATLPVRCSSGTASSGVSNWIGDRFLRVVNRLIARASVLPEQPFYDPTRLPVGRADRGRLEGDPRRARRGARRARDDLPNFQDISTDQYHLTDDDRWKTYFFYGYGFRSDANCARCPETTRLVETIPGMTTAMFSILAPGKRIPPHDGPYKGVLRYHLGLLVPEPEDERRASVSGGEVAALGRGREPRLRRHVRARGVERHRRHPGRAVRRRHARAARADAHAQRRDDQGDRVLAVHPGRQAPPRGVGAAVRPDARATTADAAAVPDQVRRAAGRCR